VQAAGNAKPRAQARVTPICHRGSISQRHDHKALEKLARWRDHFYGESKHAPAGKERVMRILGVCLIAGMALAPFAAFGQSADAKYCQALSDLYRRTSPKDSTPDAEVPAAMAKCQAGDMSGIPVLEKALTDGKVTLPPRN
jgi:hypothetical protein